MASRFGSWVGSSVCAGLVAVLVAACGGGADVSIPDEAPAPAPTGTTPPSTPTPKTPPPAATGKPGAAVALAVTVKGTGQITSEPAGIACPGTCTASFAPGTKVTLSAAPAEGWKLDAWAGACAGSGACALTLAADAAVTSSLALLDPRWDPSVGAQDCADAWGKSGEKLSACDTVADDYVVVHKSKRNVALCKNGKLVKNARSGLGFTPIGDKEKDGDGKTPEGVFFVPQLLPQSSFYKAFLISYPTNEDAQRGVAAGLITTQQRTQIASAQSACVAPPQDTGLGGNIELQGMGGDKDWTSGNVALDNTSVDLLWGSIGVGDTVVVVP